MLLIGEQASSSRQAYCRETTRVEHVGRTLGESAAHCGVDCEDLGRTRFLFIFQQKVDKFEKKVHLI